MGRAIKYYQEVDMEPWAALDWGSIKSLLWSGYNARWAGDQKKAEEAMNYDGNGDVLAIFESFPHLIWNLMQDKKIDVTDNLPYASPPEVEKVHKNLFACLQAYSEHLDGSFLERTEAWQQVEKCFEENGFSKVENQTVICKAVYDALTSFVSKAWSTTNALVIAKAHSDMLYDPENGVFSKRHTGNIPAMEFSPQMWLINFHPRDSLSVKTTKTQRGVRAIFKLSAGEVPAQTAAIPSPLEMTYYLSKGTTVKLQKGVEPGGMIILQSTSWDWGPGVWGDNTSLNLLGSEGAILLHISIRKHQNSIIFNSFANGYWGGEEVVSLQDAFIASNFNICVRHLVDGYEVLFSYQPVIFYKKRVAGVISAVSYLFQTNYSPFADTVVVSTFDSMEQLAQTKQLANSEIPGGDYGKQDTFAISTQAAFKRGANFVAVPGKKKKDNLGFEYVEQSYLGDAVTLTLADRNTFAGRDHAFTLENELTVTYGQIIALAGDFYGTSEAISDGTNETEQATRFVNAFDTLSSRSAGQPAEAIEILGILEMEVDTVNNALAHHQNPSVAYNSLPDDAWAFQQLTLFRFGVPSYLALARMNWDHFGADARTAYNAGHSKALDMAITGDLEKAYAMNAFADHFLECTFSAGNLRTPRRYLHSNIWSAPAADYCAKLMHDEDNAIGLLVENPAGDSWTSFGGNRGLDPENDDNKSRCLKALQASVDEIYQAWRRKKKPPVTAYGAWSHAPTLKSALDEQNFAPLFKNEQRRTSLKNRHDWSFTGKFDFAATTLECVNSDWWKYPILVDGPQGILDGTDVATTALSAERCAVYYQDVQGQVREHFSEVGWGAKSAPIFSAKMYTPLAVVSFDSGKEIRVYCLSEDGYLDDWCYTAGSSNWHRGTLAASKFRVAANTKLAAVQWSDDPYGGEIQEYTLGTSWTKTFTLPIAHTGSSLAAVCWQQQGIHIRVYCQAPDMKIRELSFDGGWATSDLTFIKFPRNTSLSALGWYAAGINQRLYVQDAHRNIVAYVWKFNDGAVWKLEGPVTAPLKLGQRSAALLMGADKEGEKENEVRVLYQTDDRRIVERCTKGGRAWGKGKFVSS